MSIYIEHPMNLTTVKSVNGVNVGRRTALLTRKTRDGEQQERKVTIDCGFRTYIRATAICRANCTLLIIAQ